MSIGWQIREIVKERRTGEVNGEVKEVTSRNNADCTACKERK